MNLEIDELGCGSEGPEVQCTECGKDIAVRYEGYYQPEKDVYYCEECWVEKGIHQEYFK